MGPILDTVAVSRDVEGASFLLRLFIVCAEASRFASSVATPWGYKVGSHSCTNLCPLARSPIVSPPPSLRLKKMRDREVDLET
jgi:hypothetical protein